MDCPNIQMPPNMVHCDYCRAQVCPQTEPCTMSNGDVVILCHFCELKHTPRIILNLHKQWFDLIKSGEKKEEYRANQTIKDGKKVPSKWAKLFDADNGKIKIKGVWHNAQDCLVEFRNGYATNAPKMVFKIEALTFGYPFYQWTDAVGIECFKIKLGSRVYEKAE